MRFHMRPYQSEADYWRIRAFLREISLLNDRHDYAWSLLCWDYWRWHINENIFKLNLPDVISLGVGWSNRPHLTGLRLPEGMEVFWVRGLSLE